MSYKITCLLTLYLILEIKLNSLICRSKAEIECPPGYITNNCTLPCRYPSFGPACQEKCNCKESDCNSGTGCKEDVATLYPVSSSRGELTSSTLPNALNITICPIGYFGEKCEVPCRFPNHGNGCQLKNFVVIFMDAQLTTRMIPSVM
ncbi:scavenger receptor class F member 1-like [Ostrea edulis]|uniref:scavenger receptor class F member 1-like n=1 Tax=Ostrea edulis TaxID=37623 RepID=UPI0024AEEEF9|nr:scavenger receptor class F member 1-like [Ostrea edulis]